MSLSAYMDTMRDYSVKVQAWVQDVQESEFGTCFHLSAFGGLANTTQFLEATKLPLYVFDNFLLECLCSFSLDTR